MELIIKSDVRDAIVKIVSESSIPTSQGIQIISALQNLPRKEVPVPVGDVVTKIKNAKEA